MLKKLLMTAASGALLAGVAIGASAPAQAQVGIEIGPRGARVYEDGYRPVIERRERRRVIVEDDDEDCRIVIRRRTNRFGERVTERIRDCN